MGLQFDWHIDEEADQEPGGGRGGFNFRRWRRWLWALVVFGLAAAAFWGWGEWRIRQNRLVEQARLQAVLDRPVAAFEAGDGPVFFAELPPDPSWQAEQLKPLNMGFWAGRPAVTDFERRDGEIWANVTWTDSSGIERQRVVFFEDREGSPVLLDRSQSFWGEVRQYQEPWGTLRISAADLPWQEEINRRVSTVMFELCAEIDCLPLTVAISDRSFASANAAQLILVSPRVWGLDASGEPDDRYWELLESQLREQLQPAPITFAVPAAQLRSYSDLARSYEQLFSPGRQVELVTLESLPVDPAVLLSQVDGATLTPTRELIAAGLVYDLSDLIATDPSFDQEDYYEQLWQGGRWRERMWFLPQTARLSMIYYDREMFRRAERPFPRPDWTWEELWADARFFTGRGDTAWGLVALDHDLLYSLAYNAGNSCDREVTVFCSPRLRAQDVAAAYAAYRSLADLLPDMTALTTREKQNYFMTQISVSSRNTALWVDEPLLYEQHFLSRAAGVVAFPGSATFGGVTPLHIEGNMISGLTDRPQAVWQWLKFLSYQYLIRQDRQVPGRPSVAAAHRYWETLPPELSRTMREAFPYARPILLAEIGTFNDEVLAQVLSGELSPAQAGQIEPAVRWFDRP